MDIKRFITLGPGVLITTYEWAQLARVFITAKPVELSILYHSSLLAAFISNEENSVVNTTPCIYIFTLS
jgi:hypothetical protein